MSEPDNLNVYLRLKPSKNPSSPFLTVQNSNQVVVDPPKGSRYRPNEVFSFTGIFPETCDQNDIFQTAVHPLVENVLNNKDGLLFSMGSSGSGKTHTILGYKSVPGMVHLALNTLFKSIDGKIAEYETVEDIADKQVSRKSQAVEAGLVLDFKSPISIDNNLLNSLGGGDKIDTNDKYKYAVYISMVEIHNEAVFDLYAETNKRDPRGSARPTQIIQTDPQNNNRTFLPNVRKIYVSDMEEAFKTVEHGLSNRSTHATNQNMSSSRSHAFIIIEVKRITNSRSHPSISSSTLTIADLAGSERIKVAKTEGARKQETGKINTSLMLLGQCLQRHRGANGGSGGSGAGSGGAGGGPSDNTSNLRNSKLTHLLLSNAFNPKIHQKSVLLVNMDRYGPFETAPQILQYSALARDVKVPQQTRIASESSISSRSSGSATLTDVSDYEDDSPDLFKRIKELETQLLNLEQNVREQVSDEKDLQINKLSAMYKENLYNESVRYETLLDAKVTMLKEYYEGKVNALEQENARLRAGGV